MGGWEGSVDRSDLRSDSTPVLAVGWLDMPYVATSAAGALEAWIHPCMHAQSFGIVNPMQGARVHRMMLYSG